MEKRLRLLLQAALALAAGAGFAQEHPSVYLIHQEVVKPSMVQAYEAAAKEFAAMVVRNKALVPHFTYAALAGDDFVYTYVAPIPNSSGIDAIRQDFGQLAQKEGPAFAELMKREGASQEYVKEWVVGLAPELSYAPAAPRLRREDMRYFHYDVYYVMADRGAEADALCKEFLAFFKSKNIPNGYRVFKPQVGPEMPAIIVEVGAKDPTDYETQSANDRVTLGEAGKALFAKAFAITRRFESRGAWLRPDLSPQTVESSARH
jgi:hypothetical protein